MNEARSSEQTFTRDLRRIVRMRLSLAFVLTAVLLFLFAFYMSLLSVAMHYAGVTTAFGLNLLVSSSLGLIIAGITVSGVYVIWANRIFDPRLRQILHDRSSDT